MVSLGLDSVRGHVVSEAGMGVMAVNQWRVLADCPGAYRVWFMHACMHGRSRRTGACQCTIPIVCFFFPCAVIFCT